MMGVSLKIAKRGATFLLGVMQEADRTLLVAAGRGVEVVHKWD